MAKSLFIFLLASGSLLADPASAQAVDPGIRTEGMSNFEVLPGANDTERQLFRSGLDGFGQGWEFHDGFGPRFNAFNCLNCHASTPHFEAVPSHQTIRELLDTNERSCLNCHGRAHPSREDRTPGSARYDFLMGNEK